MKVKTLIKKPLITEKSTQKSQNKVYIFEVDTNANKHQLSKSISELYKVKVASVRTITRKGKEKRVGKKMMTKKRSDKKLAYITVSEGTIDLFPQS
ncbi:50S ribosomal protein L23 [Candidatus Roizmanbacteria bacterium CG11_big_fil_rev_8_21_14_0_20_36_8]|uniref:Large ribosomal subunit protein uL23 n=2 Tax=Candidatus Roizmaniibacteriota TaxID=1752723 RepID=A0A2M6IV88_9BACT|nr:MAG: 50S ribosomal protein L23 [Candidatus Roizmanbacteria bacterium CG11_big_fil_rev_8_21_14_0_20_36_8]PIZ64885.1 MAG: 50S ribosomal protein L23 [Candidatus Roizmanbacteria bacterium CG_4_10_14_0_2_um_filter_36_9]